MEKILVNSFQCNFILIDNFLFSLFFYLEW
jgi:hypothetical protein